MVHHNHEGLHHEDLHERNIALSSVESFSFLFKSAWDVSPLGTSLTSPDHKFHINIVETILFKKGLPHRWLFTSERTNEVMKKKKERLSISNSMLIKAIKSKSKEYCVFPDKKVQLRPKVANVWHVEPSGELHCHLVDEIELGTILECPDSSVKRSIVAVQVYMAGWPYKANGIFEHKYFIDDRHMHVHETYELGHFPEKSQIAQMNTAAGPAASAKGKKIRIIETQHHMISNQVKTLVQSIERLCHCKVSRLVVQVAFDTMWKPYILSCRDVHLQETPVVFSEIRSNVLFVDGLPPDIPKKSLFYPNGTINMATASEGYGAYQYGNSIDWTSINANSQAAPQKQEQVAVDVRSQGSKKVQQLAEAQKNAFLKHILGEGFTVAAAEHDSRDDHSESGEQHPHGAPKVVRNRAPLLVDGPGAYTEEQKHTSLYVPPPNKLVAKELGKLAGSADKAALLGSMRGSAGVGESFPESLAGEGYATERFDPLSLHALSNEAIDELRRTARHPVDHKLFTQSKLTGPLTDTTVRGKDRYGNLVADPQQKKRFEMATDTSVQNLLVFSEKDRKKDLDIVLSQKLKCDDKKRRPISAPHVSRERVRTLQDRGVAGEGAARGNASRKVVNKLRNMHVAYDNNYPHENFHDKCCGDYCHFLDQMSRHIDTAFLESHKYLADVNYKGGYKSILLAREEAHFVGGHIGDQDLDALHVDQLQSSHEVDQVFAFFARKQILKVSERVREELRHAVIMGLEKKTGASPNESSDAFNSIYRRCVYAGALASVHPSRFYYTVPLCNTCYKLYMFMDHQREKVVLHNSNLDYSGHRMPAAGGGERQRPKSSSAVRQGAERRRAHRNNNYDEDDDKSEEEEKEEEVFRTFEGKRGYRNFGTMIARNVNQGAVSAIDELDHQAKEEMISQIIAKSRRKQTSRKSVVSAASPPSKLRERSSMVAPNPLDKVPKVVQRLKRATEFTKDVSANRESAERRPSKAKVVNVSNRVAIGIEKTNGGGISSWVKLQASGNAQAPASSKPRPQSAAPVVSRQPYTASIPSARPSSAAQSSSEFDYQSLPFESNAPMLPYVISVGDSSNGYAQEYDDYYDNLSVAEMDSFAGSANVSPFMHSEDQMISPIGFSSHSLQTGLRLPNKELPPSYSASSLEFADNRLITASGIAAFDKRKV